jgi:hypothetical protein
VKGGDRRHVVDAVARAFRFVDNRNRRVLCGELLSELGHEPTNGCGSIEEDHVGKTRVVAGDVLSLRRVGEPYG